MKKHDKLQANGCDCTAASDRLRICDWQFERPIASGAESLSRPQCILFFKQWNMPNMRRKDSADSQELMWITAPFWLSQAASQRLRGRWCDAFWNRWNDIM